MNPLLENHSLPNFSAIKAADVLPDIAEIAINTIINPASGVTTLVKKVAERAVESQKDDD